MPDYLRQVTLRGRHVVLEPLEQAHVDDLVAASAGDDELWRWMSVATPRSTADMRAVVEAAVAERAAGTRLPFAVRSLADGVVVGSTSYLDVVPAHRRVEIGWTWYGRRWWRTAVNSECKLLLLGHAFDTLGAARVAIKTHHRNEQSQRAIERLGAIREGVLRAHMVCPDGSRRDTVYYSVLAEEWPAVRARLEAAVSR